MVTPDAPFAVATTLFSTNLMWTTVDLLFSGKLQQFPNLQFSLAEGGIGWVPYILERIDYVWERHRYYQAIDFDTRPSELFHKHFWGCFIDDEHGLKNRHEVGIDRIMLEIDFPHSDSNWPNSRKRAAEVLADIPDEECALMVEDNARRMLSFPRTSGRGRAVSRRLALRGSLGAKVPASQCVEGVLRPGSLLPGARIEQSSVARGHIASTTNGRQIDGTSSGQSCLGYRRRPRSGPQPRGQVGRGGCGRHPVRHLSRH